MFDLENIEQPIDNGYLSFGMAGAGTTPQLNQITHKLMNNETVRAFITACQLTKRVHWLTV
jgi:hypothetical protein